MFNRLVKQSEELNVNNDLFVPNAFALYSAKKPGKVTANSEALALGLEAPKPTSFALVTNDLLQESTNILTVENFIENQLNSIMVQSIEETKTETENTCYDLLTNNIHENWAKEKKKFIDFLGNPLNRVSVIKPITNSVRTSSIDSEAIVTTKIAAYANLVGAIQTDSKINFPIVSAFASVLDESIRNKGVTDTWSLIACLLNYKSISQDGSQRGSINKKEYSYPLACNLMLWTAKAHLEKQFKKILMLRTQGNTVGGFPSLSSCVIEYLKSRPQIWQNNNASIENGCPKWLQIFYCLRCGDYDAAIAIAGSERLPTYSPAFHDLNQPGFKVDDIKMQSSSTSDEFKSIVLSILAGSEPLRNNTRLFETAEDVLWLKLTLACASLRVSSRNTLESVQFAVCQLPENKFIDRPLVYFQFLLLAQLFEKAIKFLISTEFWLEAVHFAYVFNFYGLFNITNGEDKQLFVELKDTQRGQINFAKLMCEYSNRIKYEPPFSVFYLLAVEDQQIQYNYIKDLIIQTRSFKQLLGIVDLSDLNDFTTKPTYLTKDQILNIASIAAIDCERNGEFEDAIQLYAHCSDYNKMFSILQNQLGDNLTQTSAKKQKLISMTENALNKFANLSKYSQTCLKTAQVAVFFDLVASQNYEDALNLMIGINILPLSDSAVNFNEVQQKADLLRVEVHTITQNISAILIATINCINKLYTALSSRNAINQQAQESHLEIFRQMSKILVAFAGLIRQHISSNTYADLLRINTNMLTRI
eukprot:TRINITY_DN853_c0_g2_i2.p1 TRINITY_DN853_c0_g2~~TRINITY_DN853_c0_g2_i2.p1  ORF type:complete len:760 (-),score=272.76 TRINITY_DN853_c0_g2_i2:1779-4058(-)